MADTEGQRVRRLDEMDEREAHRFVTDLAERLSPEAEYETRHPEYVMEMPQSGERFRGRDELRAFQEAYLDRSAPPSIRNRRVIVREGLWVVESVIDYGGETMHGAAVLELRDGRVWRDTRYFAEPFEAPPWRARWVERMEPDAPVVALAPREVTNPTDEREVARLIERQLEKMRAGDFAGAHEWYDEAVVVDWPQSGERIRGRANLLDLRQAYPAGVEFEARRVIPRADLGVSEYVIRYDGRPVHVIATAEFGDGRVVRETHYFAEPFEAPAWRAQWVERM